MGSESLRTRAIQTGVVDMAVIVVTRLRLKDHSYLDDFFTAAVAPPPSVETD